MENETSVSQPSQSKPKCKNCGEKLSKRGHFCPACGQRDFNGRIKMRDLLSKFFSSLTHLDNKFVKMAWHLLVPAKVSLQYFEGKIKRYPHPVQFFFIVMFFFLLLFSKQFDNMSLDLFGGNIRFGSDMSYSAGENQGVTVSKSNLFEALQRCVVAAEYRKAFEELPDSLQSEAAKAAFDSVDQAVGVPWEKSTGMLIAAMTEKPYPDSVQLDSLSLYFGFASIKISTPDFVGMAPDSIIKNYAYTSWWERTLVRQGIKTLQDQKGLTNRYVGSFGWSVLVLIAFMAWVLKLFYWKKRKYYVEHFIFLMHQQSGVFLFLTIGLLLHEYVSPLQEFWILFLGWFLLAALFSMRRFYAESWLWTIGKWVLYTALYLAMLVILFIGTLLVVFVVF